MEPTRTVETPDQIRALAHPLRQRILELMIDAPITTKQVADRIGEKPTKLYHHVETLEAAGFIRLVKTQKKRGTVEKYFEAVAERFVMDRQAVEVRSQSDGEQAELETIIATSLDETLDEIRGAMASGLIRAGDDTGESVFVRSHLRMTPMQMTMLIERLQEWIRDVQGGHDPDGELEYGLTVAFYPTKRSR
jgi:DNA-binding transcriptional ArsR family regulator|tara:strand:+ start:259 stop:834 length:576 start_codon:yes stop_codon:yes gene_type:complete